MGVEFTTYEPLPGYPLNVFHTEYVDIKGDHNLWGAIKFHDPSQKHDIRLLVFTHPEVDVYRRPMPSIEVKLDPKKLERFSIDNFLQGGFFSQEDLDGLVRRCQHGGEEEDEERCNNIAEYHLHVLYSCREHLPDMTEFLVNEDVERFKTEKLDGPMVRGYKGKPFIKRKGKKYKKKLYLTSMGQSFWDARQLIRGASRT